MNNNTSALAAARSRWWVIALLTAVGAALGALPAPARVSEESQATQYRAAHTMLLNNTQVIYSNTALVSPSQVVLLATTGEVPRRVADVVGSSDNPASLASQVSVTFDQVTGALRFETTQATAEQAVLLADTFAEQTNSYLVERQDVIYQDRLAAARTRLDELDAQLDSISSELAADPQNATLAAQQEAVQQLYSVAFQQNETLAATPASELSFTTLEQAQAIAIENKGLAAPQSRVTRGVLGGLVGAALGFGLVIVLAKLDRKIRSREQAEAATGLRVRVTVPKVRDTRQANGVLGTGHHDPLSDSYRTLRNVIAFMHSSSPAVDRARVTLVVSPGPGEGKTSLAANLAASFAELGQRTIAVNTDFRRPQLRARLSDNPDSPLPFILDDLKWLAPEQLLRSTKVPNLTLLDLARLGSADELARSTAAVLPRVMDLGDAVVIDSSPMTATAEVLEVVPFADLIVMVVKLDRTDHDGAARTVAMLRDLTTAPVILVLTGVKPERGYTYDYSDRRTRKPDADRESTSRRSDRRAREVVDVDSSKRSAGGPRPSLEPGG